MVTPKRWFWLTLVVTMMLLSGMASVNYLMDPFSKREGHEIEYDRWGANRDFNVPLWSIFSVGRIPSEQLASTEVIVLGDSRATLLTMGENGFRRFTEIGGQKVLNLSLGGGSLKENIAFFEAEEKRVGGFKELQALVFTLPFNRICEGERPNRIAQSLPMRANSLPYYFSGYTLRRSLFSVSKIGETSDQVRKQLTKEDGEKALKNWNRTYQGYDEDLANIRYANLEEFTAKLREHGVEVVFYMPPGGGSGRAIVSDVGLLDEYEWFLSRMDRMAHLENWAEAKDFDGEPFLYKIGDPIHHDKGVDLLKKMLENINLKEASE